MNGAAKQINVHIRWMMRRDMPEVLAIENDVFSHPWTEEDFIKVLRRRNCIGMVAEFDERVVGYFLYELFPHSLHIESFAVDHGFWRAGVGRRMAEKLIGKLESGRRRRITVNVRERNLDAQLFFKRMGFTCYDTKREFFNNGEDAYVFHYIYKRREGK